MPGIFLAYFCGIFLCDEAPGRLARIFNESQVVDFLPDAHRLAFCSQNPSSRILSFISHACYSFSRLHASRLSLNSVIMRCMGRPAKTPPPAYGCHLANLRKAAGLSQQELADKIGTRQSTVASWERSANPPRGEFLPKLAKILGVSADVLLQMEERQKHPGPASKIEQLFQEVSSLPRRRQERIATVVQALLAEEAQAS